MIIMVPATPRCFQRNFLAHNPAEETGIALGRPVASLSRLNLVGSDLDPDPWIVSDPRTWSDNHDKRVVQIYSRKI